MKLRVLVLLLFTCPAIAQTRKPVNLPSGKTLLAPAPGNPQTGVGSLPVAAALSPDRRYLAILDGGYGRPENQQQQGIGVLDLTTNKVAFYPDARLGQSARQTYFLGLAFSADGKHIFASIGSLTDPLASQSGSTGNLMDGNVVRNSRVADLADWNDCQANTWKENQYATSIGCVQSQ